MVTHSIFTAVVLNSNAGSHAITVAPKDSTTNPSAHGGNKLQGILVTGVISSFLGFSESFLPQPGLEVLCVADTDLSCYIIGVVPPYSTGELSLPGRSALGAGNALADSSHRRGHAQYTPFICDAGRPADMVDGEYAVSNEFGVLLGLFQQLAVLKGSELSQVQCFLLDDLVRVISHNFQHYTALGEYNIFHDGKRLMAEFGATHKTAECYGQPATKTDTPKDKPFESSGIHSVDDEEDYYDITDDERIKAIERFKVFLGSCGGFLHAFLSKPDDDAKRILDPEGAAGNPDTGLFNVHLGIDGGLHVRSAKEIFLEKTSWIRVPQRKAAPDDPKGDDASTLAYDKKEAFKFENGYQYQNNPLLYALQIRDYVAYVNEKLNYQNFKTHEKDFNVNDDFTKETKIQDIKSLDQENDLNQEAYALRTAGIYIMPNGGITIRDAWNSAIVMEGGNIYMQPAKDLIEQPMRHSITKAGGSISIVGRKHVDISSSMEGIRLKSEKAQYLYSNASGIVLESNGESNTPGNGDAPEALDYIGGVVIKSKLGIYNYAEADITSYAKGSIRLQGIDSVDIVADKMLTLLSKAQASLLAGTFLQIHSTQNTFLMADITVGIVGGQATAIGHKDQQISITYPKNYTGFVAFPSGVLEVSVFKDELDKIKEAKDKVLTQTIFGDEDLLDALKFKFPASEQYGKLDPMADGIPATLAQQDDLLTGLHNLVQWKDEPINESQPFPGMDLFEKCYYTVEKPVNLETHGDGEEGVNKANAEATPAKIEPKSLNEYKVHNT